MSSRKRGRKDRDRSRSRSPSERGSSHSPERERERDRKRSRKEKPKRERRSRSRSTSTKREKSPGKDRKKDKKSKREKQSTKKEERTFKEDSSDSPKKGEETEKQTETNVKRETEVRPVEEKKKPRKRRWDTASAGAPSDPAATAQQLQIAVAKAKAAALIKLQVQQKVAALQQSMTGGLGGLGGKAFSALGGKLGGFGGFLAQQKPAEPVWQPLVLDVHGRAVDKQGKLIETRRPGHIATFKVNQAERDIKLEKATFAANFAAELKKNAHIAATSGKQVKDKRSRGFNFVKPGKYVKKAQTLRMKQLARDMRDMEYTVEDTEVTIKLFEDDDEDVPDVEWWDAEFCGVDAQNKPTYDAPPKLSVISSEVHHPTPLAPAAEKAAPAPQQLMLTAKERRKIKRRKKMEKQKDIQDKIRFGLMDTPEPKMKLSNIMKVLADESVANPSQAEAKVRAQMKERKTKHESENRRLTKEERAAKHRRKLKEDTSVEVNVAVFRAGDLTNDKRRGKVNVNAQQYNLTGVALLYQDCNAVIVEGGPKGVGKFIKLMTRRIKWVQDAFGKDIDSDDEDSEDEDGGLKHKQNQCVLLWTGVMARRKFRNFTFENCRTEGLARKFLENKDLEQYWDMCRNYKEVEL